MRRLYAEGLIEIEPYRGAIVSRPTRADVDGLLRVREYLEGLAARQAAERSAHSQNRKKAIAAQKQFTKSHARHEVFAFLEENEEFHTLIIQLSGNTHLERIIPQLQLPAFRTAFFRLIDQPERDISLEQHATILNAIIKGDPNNAEEAMRRHVRRTSELVSKLPDSLFSP